jgi:hypothetical protein
MHGYCLALSAEAYEGGLKNYTACLSGRYAGTAGQRAGRYKRGERKELIARDHHWALKRTRMYDPNQSNGTSARNWRSSGPWNGENCQVSYDGAISSQLALRGDIHEFISSYGCGRFGIA